MARITEEKASVLDKEIANIDITLKPNKGGMFTRQSELVDALEVKKETFSELVLTPGKSVTVTTFVDETKTARCVGSGSLDVFATPMMVAQMEYAACEVLKSAMNEGQTSVGTFISVNHNG